MAILLILILSPLLVALFMIVLLVGDDGPRGTAYPRPPKRK